MPKLKSRQWQSVLADCEPAPLPIRIVYQEGRQAAASVRAFIDLIAERLRAEDAIT